MVSLEKVCKISVGAKQTTPMISKNGRMNTENHLILTSLYAHQIQDHDLYKHSQKPDVRTIKFGDRAKSVIELRSFEDTVFDKLDSKDSYR